MIVNVIKANRDVAFGLKDKNGEMIAKYKHCKDIWVVGLSKRTQGLYTGLTPKEERDFEKLMGLEEGTLSIQSNYWKNYKIVIPEKGLQLNTDDPDDALKYKLLSNDPKYANGKKEFDNSAKARFVMSTEGEESKSNNKAREIRRKAMKLYDSLSQVEMVDVLGMLGINATNMKPEMVEDKVGEMAEKNPEKFITIAGDPSFKEKVWLTGLISDGVIEQSNIGGGKITLMYGTEFLGDSLEAAILTLMDPKKQKIKIALKKLGEDK